MIADDELLLLPVVVAAVATPPAAMAAPATAQQMHDDGVALPWFHSRAEQMARDACENDLPECRDSVRKQLATEKAITRTLPSSRFSAQPARPSSCARARVHHRKPTP